MWYNRWRLSERLNHGNFWRFRRLKHRRLNDGFAASFTPEPLCPLFPGRCRAAGPAVRRPFNLPPPPPPPPPPRLLEANSAPGTPSSVSLTRADGTVTADWPAVSGASKYHVTYTTDGGSSWHAPVNGHTNIQTNTLTFNADNSKSYMVGVRAGNDYGWGGWRNSPQAGPYTPPQPTPTPTPTPKPDPTATPTPQPEPTATPTPEPEPTATPTPEPEPTATPAPTATPEPEPTATPTPQPASAPSAPTGVSATGGDQTITLAWNNPGDASVTGYQFQINHTNTSTGKLSGWGQWWDVPNGNANTTSYTIGGVANGKEYRFKLRAVNAAGESKPAPRSAPWYVVATPKALDAPSNLSVTPGSGVLVISWDAVSGATGYDVRSSEDGVTWTMEHSNVSATTVNVANADEAIEQIGVRARNAQSQSAWTTKRRMPPAAWLTTVQQSGASAQSVQGQSQLAAPATITVTRDNDSRDEKLYVSWAAVTGASGYNVTCSHSGGWSWWQCGSTTSATSLTVDRHPLGDLSNIRTYLVAVRAVTSTPADASDWKRSEDIRPVMGWLFNLTTVRTDNQIALSWTPNIWTTGYQVYCDTHTAGATPSYTLCATLTGQDDTAASHSVTITKSGGTYNWSSLDNTSILDIKITSKNQWGDADMFVPLVYPKPVTLTVSNVGVTTARLTIANHSNAWYYKANAAPDNTCKGPVNAGTSTKDLTGLTANVTYDYAAYSDSACTTANELASATGFTTLSSVSNLGSTHSGDSNINNTLPSQAVAFTTGTAATSGYVLKSVTMPMSFRGGSGGLTVTLREMHGGGTYNTNKRPSDTVEATLSGNAPTSGSYTNTTFTCSGSDCELDPGKTYFIVATRTGTAGYYWSWAGTEVQTRLPSDNGWEVESGHYLSGTNWASWGDWNRAEIVFAPKVSLTSSNIGATTATLNIVNYSGNWYYKADAAPDNTCQGPVDAGTKTKDLTGLSPNTSYTYEAYSDSACTTANKLAKASAFTTFSSVSNLGETADDSGMGIRYGRATSFTTGSHTAGYSVPSITINVTTVSNKRAPGITLKILGKVQAGGPNNSNEICTLSLVKPEDPGEDHTATAPDTGCDLAASTEYYLVAVEKDFSGGNSSYSIGTTESDDETNTPSGFGWSIENTAWFQDSSSAWSVSVWQNSPAIRAEIFAAEK